MKASEQRLLLLLIILVAVFATGFATLRMLNWQRTLEKKTRSVAMRTHETQQLLTEAPMWEERLAWLRTSQPQMTSVNKANNDLDQSLVETAKNSRVSIENKQLQEPVETPYFHQVGETVLVKTEVKSLMQWLHELQSPESFTLVSHLTIQSAPEDAGKVTATVHVSRLFSPHKPATENTVENKAP
ncbi:MAG: GspMb/PilO family protein [Prosthecobacter sp.]